MSVMSNGETLSTLADLIGAESALHLLSCRGGEEVYIPGPERLTPDHWLSVTVGFNAAMKISDVYGRGILPLPMGPESGNRSALQRMVIDCAAAGLSTNQIVRETGLPARTVRRIKNRRNTLHPIAKRRSADPRQMNLFNNDMEDNDGTSGISDL